MSPKEFRDRVAEVQLIGRASFLAIFRILRQVYSMVGRPVALQADVVVPAESTLG